MQYPIATRETKYELVAVAHKFAKGTLEYYLVWKLNDGHTVKSIDGIKPTEEGQLLCQPYGYDTNRFIVEPKDANTYNFSLDDKTLPYPQFVFSKRHLKAGVATQVTLTNADSSAELTLVCDNTNVEITRVSATQFTVKANTSIADSMVTFTATAVYSGRVYNSINKDMYIAESMPELPVVLAPKQGVVNTPLQFEVTPPADSNIQCFTDNGIVASLGENKWTITRNTQGISRIIAVAIRDNGITSELVQVEVSFFNS